MPTHPGRPQPEPLKTNDVRVAAAGTALWLVALVVLLVVGLPSDQRWWLWVCVTGAAIGVFACLYIPRLQRKRATEDAPDPHEVQTAREVQAAGQAETVEGATAPEDAELS